MPKLHTNPDKSGRKNIFYFTPAKLFQEISKADFQDTRRNVTAFVGVDLVLAEQSSDTSILLIPGGKT